MLNDTTKDIKDKQLNACEEGFSPETIKQKVEERVEELENSYFQKSLPEGFRFKGGWLEYFPLEKNGKGVNPKKICTKFKVGPFV